jgi:NAD(P)-dependent dehydrogenase (short-subunit alcohol dehydrogenase family)
MKRPAVSRGRVLYRRRVKKDQIDAAAVFAIKMFGRIDVWVNNASRGAFGSPLTITAVEIQEMAVNVHSAVMAARRRCACSKRKPYHRSDHQRVIAAGLQHHHQQGMHRLHRREALPERFHRQLSAGDSSG